ncbi:MAG: MogA/MoaB family molybdenum cofactor biosynthesis protein [Candidatus Bathyarchaeota archaeon]
MVKSYTIHKRLSPKRLSFVVITVSTSKYLLKSSGKEVKDLSGDLAVQLLEKAGHKILDRQLIPDNPKIIRKTVLKHLRRRDVEVLLLTGGTGITKSDVSVEVVEKLLQKKLPGFGELLRKLSYEKIGSAAILTRATAGVVDDKVIFCLPGSPDAVKLAVKKLIIPEAPHIVKHAKE